MNKMCTNLFFSYLCVRGLVQNELNEKNPSNPCLLIRRLDCTGTGVRRSEHFCM